MCCNFFLTSEKINIKFKQHIIKNKLTNAALIIFKYLINVEIIINLLL